MEIIYGDQIENYLDKLGNFRIEVFKEYPYLYDGDLKSERKYLDIYTKSKESILLLIQEKNKIIAGCTGIPLKYESDEFKQPFDIDSIDKTFYIGELMIKDGFRNAGLGSKMLAHMIDLIDKNLYKQIALCTIDRKDVTPPNNYFSPEYLWQKFGFKNNKNLSIYLSWKDINQELETEKKLNIWLKDI